MRHFNKWLTVAAISATILACNDTRQIGIGVQPPDDKIMVLLDTFSVKTYDSYAEGITAQCDTGAMALGEFYSERFGSTRAELLLQFAPPVGYKFPPDSLNPVADSLVLNLYYSDWFGSETSPIEISIYEINKKAIEYDEFYLSNFDIDEFTDQSVLMGQRIVTSIDQTLSDSVRNSDGYSPRVRYRFSGDQLDRFFNMKDDVYASQEAFNEAFKGLYITTKYGASTMFYFNQVTLQLFYHYNVKRDGRDTTLSTSIVYPVNKEVRQLNHFSHERLPEESIEEDSLCLVKSPAGIFPRVVLPIGEIREHVREQHFGSERLFNVNSATLEAEVVVDEDAEIKLGKPGALLLIRESKLDMMQSDNYTIEKYDSVATLAEYDPERHSYQFDLAYIISHEVRTSTSDNETETFVIVPCLGSIDDFNSSDEIGYEAAPLRHLSGVAIRSGSNATSPLRLKMTYNGF